MLEVFNHCYHQLLAVAQEIDWCLSSEEMSEEEQKYLEKLYKELGKVLDDNEH